MQTGAPHKFELLFKIPCGNDKQAILLERKLHGLLKSCRHRGEWYHCNGVMGMIRRLSRSDKSVFSFEDVRTHLRDTVARFNKNMGWEELPEGARDHLSNI